MLVLTEDISVDLDAVMNLIIKNLVDLVERLVPSQLITLFKFLARHQQRVLIYQAYHRHKIVLGDLWEVSLIYGETCFTLGRMEEYYKHTKASLMKLLEAKYYSALRVYFEKNRAYCETQRFFFLAELIYLSEIKAETNLLKILSDTNQKNLFEVLSVYQYELPKIHQIVFEKKIEQKHLFAFLPNEIIEYLLICDTDKQRLLAYEVLSENEEIQKEIEQIAKKELKVKPHQLHPLNHTLKKSYFNRKIARIIPSNIELNPEVILEESVREEGKPTSPVQENYNLSDDEKRLIMHFEYDQRTQQETYELVHSFIAINYYTLALNLVAQLKFSSEKLYLSGWLSYQVRDYANCIYFINEYLGTIEPHHDQTPFLKLKRKAFFQLNDMESVHSIDKQLNANGTGS